MKRTRTGLFLVAALAFGAVPLYAGGISFSVDPYTTIFGCATESPRIAFSVAFPLRDRFALDIATLGEWSSRGDSSFAQCKADVRLRWFLRPASIPEGTFRGVYLAGGLGVGFAAFDGKDDYALIALGPAAEVGYRYPFAGTRAFAEPFLGGGAYGGPRFGGASGWSCNVGYNVGLRFGYTF